MPRTYPDVPSIGSINHCHGGARGADPELLADDPVLAALGAQPGDDGGLRGAVDLGDLCAVNLVVDREVPIVERRECDRVGLVGQCQGELELGVHAGATSWR